MKNTTSVNLELMEGRTFILGREGHIYIDSSTASKHHAEIRITDGKIYLRDLDSTNGTFLMKNRSLVHFDEGFVSPMQPVVIGGKTYVIKDLLAIANNFVAANEGETVIEVTDDSKRRAING